MLKKSTHTFLRQLAKNNDRTWFEEHRDTYEAARGDVASFADELLQRLRQTDRLSTPSGKKSMFRIYRDVRFSKDKSPYKTSLSGHFVRDGLHRRGGYYFHFSPNSNVIGGGFYGIEKDDLKRIREELAADAEPMRAILADKDFRRVFGEMQGEQLKTAPKGYPKDHPNIDLLRYKQFYAMREFSKEEVTSSGFLDVAEKTMLTLRPFFDYFSMVLTTDANGESIV